jgi:hypothetical protein
MDNARCVLRHHEYLESENCNFEYFKIIAKDFPGNLAEKINDLARLSKDFSETKQTWGDIFIKYDLAIKTNSPKVGPLSEKERESLGKLTDKQLILAIEAILTEVAKAKLALLKQQIASAI